MGSRGASSKSSNGSKTSSVSSIVKKNVMSQEEIDLTGVKEINFKAIKDNVKSYLSRLGNEKEWNKVVDDIKFWEHPWFPGNLFATYKNRVLNFNMRYSTAAKSYAPIANALSEGRYKQNESKSAREIYDNMFSVAIINKG